jgi:hypothetical protein
LFGGGSLGLDQVGGLAGWQVAQFGGALVGGGGLGAGLAGFAVGVGESGAHGIAADLPGPVLGR